MATLKLRDTKPLPASPGRKHASLQLTLVEKFINEFGPSVPASSHKHFYQYVSSLVKDYISGHSTLTVHQFKELENLARQAAHKLSGAKEELQASSKQTKRPATVDNSTANVSRSEEDTSHLSTTVLPSSPIAAAGASTLLRDTQRSKSAGHRRQLPEELAAKTLSKLSEQYGELPEPDLVAKRRKQDELLESCTEAVKIHELQRMKEKKIEYAFAAATDELVRRGKEVDEKQRAEAQSKLRKTADEIRAYLKEHEEYQRREKENKLKEEDAFLRRLRAELDAELAHAAALREKEREGILLSVKENERLRILRAEQKRQAVLEAKRMQDEYVAQEHAKEVAHRKKYENIAKHQERLAEQLLEATSATRENQARLEKLSIEYAELKEKQDAEREERKKQRLRETLAEQFRFTKAVMAEKEAAKKAAREQEQQLAITGKAEALAARETIRNEKLAEKNKKVEYRRLLADQLKTKAEILEATKLVDNTRESFIINTKSSDLDLESAFIRSLRLQTGDARVKGNNSEAVAPILGFGAPFPTAIEAAAESKFNEEEGAHAAVDDDILRTMRPKTCYVPPPAPITSPLGKK